MSPNELHWIQKRQKEFKEKFNKDLIIDFSSMNEIPPETNILRFYRKSLPAFETDKVFYSLLKKHDLSLESVTKIRTTETNVKLFLKEFSLVILKTNHSIPYAANLINKHRSVLYYYAHRKIRKNY